MLCVLLRCPRAHQDSQASSPAHLLGLRHQLLECSANLGIKHAAPPPLQLRFLKHQQGSGGGNCLGNRRGAGWQRRVLMKGSPWPSTHARQLPRPRLTLSVVPALAARGRTTQKGSGWKQAMAWCRSTQKLRVGVWQGP